VNVKTTSSNETASKATTSESNKESQYNGKYKKKKRSHPKLIFTFLSSDTNML
jgi:hypothetical protein